VQRFSFQAIHRGSPLNTSVHDDFDRTRGGKMPLVSFQDLIADANRNQYAIGYFESWNMESLEAVADASESKDSPVLLGFSGLYLDHAQRRTKEHLSVYASLGLEVCRRLKTPACLVYNESPDVESVRAAIELGFGLVMFSDETLGLDEQTKRVCQVATIAHEAGVAVEGEPMALPGVGGGLSVVPDNVNLTTSQVARDFVLRTGVDALAVNVGQVHIHGRSEVRLDLARLAEIGQAVNVPLVLHGGSSVARSDLQAAIRLGVRKINIASLLKQAYLKALGISLKTLGNDFNPYEVIGSGLEEDVLGQGRLALQRVVEDFMYLFGSVGRANSILHQGNSNDL
jgi:fructose/tagatose bisphosphate aldolase